MPTHVALLRAVNVGKSVRLPMAELRELAEARGHGDVATHLQSGNLVFTPAEDLGPEALAADLATALEAHLGAPVPVIVLTAPQWRALMEANPYAAQADSDPTTVHATIRAEDVTPEQREAALRLLADSEASGSEDHLSVVGRTIYLSTPAGLGRSRLAERLSRSRATGQDQATARNWRTVEAVAGLLG